VGRRAIIFNPITEEGFVTVANVQSEITSPKALFSSYQQLISQAKAHKQQQVEDAKRQQDFVAHQSRVEKMCRQVRQLEQNGKNSETLPELLNELGVNNNLNMVYKKYVDDKVLEDPEVIAAFAATRDKTELQDLCAELRQHHAEKVKLERQIESRKKAALRESMAQKEAEAAELAREQLKKDQALAAKLQKSKSLKKKLVLTSIFIGCIIAFVKFQ